MSRFWYEEFRRICSKRTPRITQKDVAAATGRAISTISGWGIPPHYSQPDQATIDRVEDYLGVPRGGLRTDLPMPTTRPLSASGESGRGAGSYESDLVLAASRLPPDVKYRLLADLITGREPEFLSDRERRILALLRNLSEFDRGNIEMCLQNGGHLRCFGGGKLGEAQRGGAPHVASTITTPR